MTKRLKIKQLKALKRHSNWIEKKASWFTTRFMLKYIQEN